MKKEYHAWAIETRYVDIDGTYYNNFIGRYWFSDFIPESSEGCKTTLFKTREIAREKLRFVRLAYKKARVVKVWVTIETA